MRFLWCCSSFLSVMTPSLRGCARRARGFSCSGRSPAEERARSGPAGRALPPLETLLLLLGDAKVQSTQQLWVSVASDGQTVQHFCSFSSIATFVVVYPQQPVSEFRTPNSDFTPLVSKKILIGSIVASAPATPPKSWRGELRGLDRHLKLNLIKSGKRGSERGRRYLASDEFWKFPEKLKSWWPISPNVKSSFHLDSESSSRQLWRWNGIIHLGHSFPRSEDLSKVTSDFFMIL